MKKLFICLSTVFCTVLIAVSIYTMNFKPTKQAQNQPTAMYTITDYKGKLAVMKNGSSEPIAVYEVYTHLLPENDIELLRVGISVYNETELAKKLEDFGL